MLWDKKKYTITVDSGSGSANTDTMRGLCEHFIVIPTTTTTVYDITLTDRDGDVIYRRIGETGRLDDKEGIPLGKDRQDKLTINLTNVSNNEDIVIIFKNR